MGENAFATRVGGPEPGDQPPSVTPKVDPFIGQLVQGRYRIISRIGDGGMGTVYLADQLSVGRKVALKVLHGEFSTTEEFVSRFRQEARLAASLSDRNVVTVYDFAQTDDGRLFIAMEYVDGRTLSDVIKQDGALSLGRVVRLASRIASGLRAAHRAGVVHRDIKPQNIMVLGVSGEEEVKLTDFGIARMRDVGSAARLTKASVIMGTPEYMAPEQIQDGEVTEQTDIYAFGVVLYEMLSGDVPFNARTPAAVLTKHLQERPRPLGERRRGAPPELERLVMQTLEKKPEDRPSDMSEVVKKLHAVRLTTGSPADSVTVAVPRWDSVSRWRSPWRLGIAGGVFAVIVLALLVAFPLRGRSDRPAPAVAVQTRPSLSSVPARPQEPLKPEGAATPPPVAAPEPSVEPSLSRTERTPEPLRPPARPEPSPPAADPAAPKIESGMSRPPVAPHPKRASEPPPRPPRAAAPEKSFAAPPDSRAVKRDVESALASKGFGQVRVEMDEKGTVLLMGSVTGGERAKQAAIGTAQQVRGVTSVKSSLFVWEEITGQPPAERPERSR